MDSEEQWRGLYAAASRFKQLRCWEWMEDAEIFGVQNPETSEIGYCSVLGNLGELFGLVVYNGSEGLEILRRMHRREFNPDDWEIMVTQDCLMATFQDREDLEKEDRATIKSLGLRFRGRSQWPLFRSYRPGYYPWHLTHEEIVFLTAALEQATDVCSRAEQDPDLLTRPDRDEFLVRVCQEEGDWEDRRLAPAALMLEMTPRGPFDSPLLKRLKTGIPRSDQVWEADMFYTPMVIEEEGTPFYARMMMCVEQDSGFVFSPEMLHPDEGPTEFCEHFLSIVEATGLLPAEIWIKREELMVAIESTASQLKISLNRVDQLPALEEAASGLLDYLDR